ncbi:MAG: DGQHR domain-containing protein [Candidatus Delongbacteria bacterium]|nr:DGQHR domain-containing protein [Candidatus Delongbacteria bacterium]
MNRIELNNEISLEQSEVTMHFISMTSEELIDNSIVEYFDGNESNIYKGYQRQLVRSHYMKIVNFLVNDDKPLLPTAILAAIDNDDVKINNSSIFLNSKLRIVDGQHRIKALHIIKENYHDIYKNKCRSMKFPVILLRLDKNNADHRLLEIRSFVDINQKGKKVNTDLAKSLIKPILKKRVRDNQASSSEVVELYANEVCTSLNQNKYSSWYNAIRLGDGLNTRKPVGINMFIESLKPIILAVLKKEWFDDYGSDIDVEKLCDMLIEYWNIIGDKWSDAFYWEESINSFRVDTNYSIQKGIGVHPLHQILAETIENTDVYENVLLKAKDVIDNSSVTSESWIRGGEFSIYNSKSGFQEIIRKIKARNLE